jgi:DNA-binding GntR family transcriptional regulator
VVRRLLTAIFQGELPAGMRLVAKKLADRLGVSATPIREALVELEQIDVVQLCHNRGALVKPFGPDQLREIFHVRSILEGEAVRCACGRLNGETLGPMRDQLADLIDRSANPTHSWIREALLIDGQLHSLIAQHCGNSRLAGEIRRYETLSQSMREVCASRPAVQRQAIADHLQIVIAMLASDAKAASAAFARHIDNLYRLVQETLFPRSQESAEKSIAVSPTE